LYIFANKIAKRKRTIPVHELNSGKQVALPPHVWHKNTLSLGTALIW